MGDNKGKKRLLGAIFKIIISGVFIIFLVIISSYLIFMYFFTKPANPIAEYKLLTTNDGELERKINKLTKDNLIDSAKVYNQPQYIVLGKDSSRYYFTISSDKNESRRNKKYWVELVMVCDSNSKLLPINYTNRKDHLDQIKIFEEEFINKLKKTK